MRRVAAAVLGLVLLVVVAAPLRGFAAGGGTGRVQESARFVALDVFVDVGGAELGAYQVELKALAEQARVVGIEGGEHAAFSSPPFYDPAALHEAQLRERIVLAAFSTAPELPGGRTRVARIHVRIAGEARYEAAVVTAGARDGSKIEAKVEVVPVD